MVPVATIYVITNRLNGHTYVGVTRGTSEERWKQHVTKALFNARTYLHRAIAKYGPDAFTVEAVASCLAKDTAGSVERTIIQQLAPVYNQTNGGEITFGRTFSAEARAKMSIRASARKFTAEQNKKQSIRKKEEFKSNPYFRAKALEALARGRANPEVQKRRAEAAGNAARSRVWSDESRARLSVSCMGRVYDREILGRMAQAKKKPVECHQLNTIFDSVSGAAESLGMHTSTVSKACLGKLRTAHGLTFSFVTN